MPPLTIVILVVGTRGDVVPFISLAVRLQRAFGHRVRLATHGFSLSLFLSLCPPLCISVSQHTHPITVYLLSSRKAIYRELVTQHHLEFYPLAGDPRLLSEWMVKQEGGLLPKV